jgi:hypothetical protein
LGCEDAQEPAPADDALASALADADRVFVAALVEFRESSDAGAVDGSVPDDNARLISDFVELDAVKAREVLDILAAPDSYMQYPNACVDRDIAFRILEGDERRVEVSIGLVCNNVGFWFNGQREWRSLNYPQKYRLGELAHEAVPAIEPHQD